MLSFCLMCFFVCWLSSFCFRSRFCLLLLLLFFPIFGKVFVAPLVSNSLTLLISFRLRVLSAVSILCVFTFVGQYTLFRRACIVLVNVSYAGNQLLFILYIWRRPFTYFKKSHILISQYGLNIFS